MKSKSYLWDVDLGNYRIDRDAKTEVVGTDESLQPETAIEQEDAGNESLLLGNYEELLSYLLQKEDVLRRLLAQKESTEAESTIPRYAVPGIFVTKSVHMTNQLDQMVRDFSKEKNVSQRELVEVALVEFFQKYGYKREVDILLQQK